MIVEDNQTIRKELKVFLKKHGYEVFTIDSFDNVVKEILDYNPDCLLLDLSLPNVDGHYISRELRKKSLIPIIVVTSRDSSIDELISMQVGADDYITKPYDLQILLARLEALLRRTYESNIENNLYVKGIKLDLAKGLVIYRDKELNITKNEIFILSYLMINKNQIVKREEIMKHLWGSDMYIDDNTLTVNINRLRSKLNEIEIFDLIETKRGMGYMINED